MISNKDIVKAYMDLYVALRCYLWDYKFVEALIDMESEALKKFPDFSYVLDLCNNLKYRSSCVLSDDEDLAAAFDSFIDVVESASRYNEYFCYLPVNIKQ